MLRNHINFLYSYLFNHAAATPFICIHIATLGTQFSLQMYITLILLLLMANFYDALLYAHQTISTCPC